jgi:hypothetical protein
MKEEKQYMVSLSNSILGCKEPSPVYSDFLYEMNLLFFLRVMAIDRPHNVNST